MSQDLLNYYLGPTGLPDRLRALNALLNPYAEPVRAAGLAMDESLTPESRREQAAYAASQAGIASLPGALYARRAAGALRNMMQPDPQDVTAGRAVIRRDDVYRGDGRVSVSREIAASDAPYAVRATGRDQLEDMIQSGLVRPRPGGYGNQATSTLYFAPSQVPHPMDSILTRLTPKNPVGLVGRPQTLGAYEGGIPIDELERVLIRQDDGTLLDMLSEILARNRAM